MKLKKFIFNSSFKYFTDTLFFVCILYVFFGNSIFFSNLSLLYKLLIYLLPILIISTLIGIILFISRSRITKDNFLICGNFNFIGKELYKFQLKDIKEIIFVRSDWLLRYTNVGGPRSIYRTNIFLTLDTLSRKGQITTDVTHSRKNAYFQDNGIYTNCRTNTKLFKNHSFVKDGLHNITLSNQIYVMFFKNKIGNYSFSDFKFDDKNKIFLNLSQELKDNFLGLNKFNKKLMGQVYKQINVPNLVIGSENSLIDKNVFKSAFVENSKEVDFFDLEMPNYFEAIEERKKYLFVDYLKEKFPEQTFTFEGEIDYER